MTTVIPLPRGQSRGGAGDCIFPALLRTLGAGCVTASLFGWLYGLLAFTGFQEIFPGAVVGGSGGELYLTGMMVITPMVSLAVLIRGLVRPHPWS